MSKKAKLITIISSAVLAVALITLIICLVVANNNREKTNQTIISCVAGSSIQMILNENDKVTTVVPLTDNAKGIALNNDFTGLKYNKAIEEFVQENISAGYLDCNTTGYIIEISIDGDKKSYSKLQSELTSAINDYLDQMGIVAGAKVSTSNSLKGQVLRFNKFATDLDGKNNSQLMEKYLEMWNLVQDVTPSYFDDVFEYYKTENDKYNTEMKELEEEITVAEQELTNLNKEFDELQKVIDSLPDGDEKTAKISERDEKSSQISQKELNIEGLEREKGRALKAFNDNITEIIQTRTRNKETNNKTLKEAHLTNKTNYANTLTEHKTNFENNKQATLDKISEFRKAINA